jgi:hypothetical integral membrane protein (TIGR02206 family)
MPQPRDRQTTMPPFERWGLQHLTALLITAAFALALTAVVRRTRDERLRRTVRAGLAGLLVAIVAAVLAREHAAGPLHWWDLAPLQLCDLAIVVTLYALVTLKPLAVELAYFWGGSGTFIAMLTPDLREGFPSWWFFTFFTLHGGVVAAALVLTVGLGLAPRKGAVLRTLFVTNAYALVVGIVDAVTGANFMYLRAKPMEPSLLDHLGPWPVYILGGEVVAAALFLLLDLPFRLRYSQHSIPWSIRR